jgi:hypothetical protein
MKDNPSPIECIGFIITFGYLISTKDQFGIISKGKWVLEGGVITSLFTAE